MSIGQASIGEVAIGGSLDTLGIPIIVEVTQATRELVIVVEVDLIQPNPTPPQEA